MAVKQARTSGNYASSASTTQSEVPASVFSDRDDQKDLSTLTTPGTPFMDDEEVVEISRSAFGESSKKRKRSDSDSEPAPEVILGSTFGGKDPLQALLQEAGIEPQHWRDERERNEGAAQYEAKSRKRSKGKLKDNNATNTKYLNPERYENLPFSPQDYFTSGLDLNSEPETSASFWRRVKKGWRWSCRFESVDARRKRFAKLTVRG